jgi:lysophospholipase L1-like esterase
MLKTNRAIFTILLAFFALAATAQDAMPQTPALKEFPLKEGDRILWYGSSSTAIGVWPRTMEFLLNTRHPELKLTFVRRGVGGSSFVKALKEMDDVYEKAQPTIVFYNFGANDAVQGEKGLPDFLKQMGDSVQKVHEHHARVLLICPQPGDENVAGKRNDFLELYAREMLAYGRREQVDVVDTYTPLDRMLHYTQNDLADYTFNKDRIHLTDSGYVAWGLFLYEGLHAPEAESSATLDANGSVIATARCGISKVEAKDGALRFVREDAVLPLLPPNPIPKTKMTAPNKSLLPVSTPATSPALSYAQAHGSELPPRAHCPLEKHSRYLLKVTGLKDGAYAILVDGKPLGNVSAAQLAEGVNLNSVSLDSGHDAPWAELVQDIWNGKKLDKIGKTSFAFTVQPAQ